MTVNLRSLYSENAMMDEGGRVLRRFLRTGAETGKALNYVLMGLLALFYLWFCAMVLRTHSDLSMEIAFFEFGVVTLLLPATVFTAIAGERERATWDALALTRLTPGQILVGKLGWRIALIVTLMALFAGPVWISHFSGDSHPYPMRNVAMAQIVLFIWFALVLCLGLFVSANTKRSVTSVAVTYAVLLFTLALVPALLAMFDVHTELSRMNSPVDALGWLFTRCHPLEALDMLARKSPVDAWGSDLDHLNVIQYILLLIGAYAAQIVALLYLTHRSLKRLCRGRG